MNWIKGSSDQSHYIFEINVGKSRIRHRTTLKLNFYIDSKSTEDHDIETHSRSMPDPPLSDIGLKNKMVWVRTTLNIGPYIILSVRNAEVSINQSKVDLSAFPTLIISFCKKIIIFLQWELIKFICYQLFSFKNNIFSFISKQK